MAKCEPGCTCGRHKGPWAGKKRPDMAGKATNLRHGHTGENPVTGKKWVSPTYKSWQAMKNRCRPGQKYGLLGITVCERWLVFENFLADMGERPNRDYSIERINTYGNYEQGNCKWATRSEQQRNKRPMPDQPNQYR